MAVAPNLVGNHTTDYYYSVFNMHMCHYLNSTCAPIPETVAEVGPGGCLAAGLTSLLAGSRKLCSFDLVDHDLTENVQALHELIDLVRRRESPHNVDHFPSYRFIVGPGGFSSRVFDKNVLEHSLDEERIGRIEKALLGEPGADVEVMKVIPWQGESHAHLDDTVDFIFSHSVMEHVDDIEDAYARMYRYLRPGGGMSHSIDFKSHGYAKEFNGHLGIRKNRWEKLVRGQPYSINRRLLSEHIAAIERAGFRVVMRHVRTLNNGLQRHQVAPRFRKFSDHDIACGNLFVQAVKPTTDPAMNHASDSSAGLRRMVGRARQTLRGLRRSLS